MRQPYHARLQKLMIQFIRENGGEFGKELSKKRKFKDGDYAGSYVGIAVGTASCVGVDEVAMHMATAAAAAFEAIADTLGVRDAKMFEADETPGSNHGT